MRTLLFADNQVSVSNTDDNVQKEVYKLIEITKDYKLTFKGLEPIRSKIVINKDIFEQVNHSNI